jgi:hypothetical protein
MARSVKRLAKQRRQASRRAASPPTLRYVSCWPAKLTFGRSSAVAELRTARVSSDPYSSRRRWYAPRISAWRSAGIAAWYTIALAACGQIGEIGWVQTFQGRAKWSPGARSIQNVPVCVGGDGEPVGHQDTLRAQRAIHLPQGGIFASDKRHVVAADLLEGSDVPAVCSHIRWSAAKAVPCRRAPRWRPATAVTALDYPRGGLRAPGRGLAGGVAVPRLT